MRPRLDLPAWLVVAAAELRMLRRSAFTLIMAAVLPTMIGLVIVWAEADTGKAGWGTVAGLLLITLMTFTTYAAGTTALAARRQQFVLKRLRLSSASDAAIIVGTVAPLALLTVLQTPLLFGIVAIVDGLPPLRWVVLLLTLGVGTAAAGVLAVATAALTPTPELAQLTTTPLGLAFVGGGLWAARTPPDEVSWQLLALPGAAITQLTRFGWHELGMTRPAAAAVALVALTIVVGPVAVRCFGWDPRR